MLWTHCVNTLIRYQNRSCKLLIVIRIFLLYEIVIVGRMLTILDQDIVFKPEQNKA